MINFTVGVALFDAFVRGGASRQCGAHLEKEIMNG